MLVLRISDLPSIIWKIKIFHVRYEFMYMHIKKYYEKKQTKDRSENYEKSIT